MLGFRRDLQGWVLRGDLIGFQTFEVLFEIFFNFNDSFWFDNLD